MLRIDSYNKNINFLIFYIILSASILIINLKIFDFNAISNIKSSCENSSCINTTISQHPGNTHWGGFDKNFNTQFHSERLKNNGIITIDLPSSEKISQISISPQSTVPERAPKTLQIEARNDDQDWEILNYYEKINFNGLKAGDYIDLPVGAKIPYRHFKLHVSNENSEYLTFSEIKLTSQKITLKSINFIILIILMSCILLVNIKLNNKKCNVSNIKNHNIILYVLLSAITSLLLVTIIDLLIATIYNPNIEEIKRLTSETFTEINKSALYPEPLERLLYILNIISLPFILLASSILYKKIIRINNLNLFLISSNLIYILIFLNLILTFIYYNNSYIYAEILKQNFTTNISYIFLFSPLIYLLLKNTSYKFLELVKKYLYFFTVGLTCISLVVIHAVVVETYPGSLVHLGAVYFSVVQVINGANLLIDTFAQYGLYSLFLLPIFKLLGSLTVLKFSIVMGILTALSFLFLALFLNKIFKNRFVSLITFIAIISISYIWARTYIWWDAYFQYWPIRTIFPCLGILIISQYIFNKSALKYWSTTAILSIGVLWNFDSGVVVFITWIALLFYIEFFQKSYLFALVNCIKHTVIAVGCLIFTIIIFLVYTKIYSGEFPDLGLLSKYQKIFYISGFYMVPMPIIHPWNIIAIIYLIGLSYSINALVNKDLSTTPKIIFLLSLIGIGLFSYYQGRSVEGNFLTVIYPGIILVGFYIDLINTKLCTNIKLTLMERSSYIGLMVGMLICILTAFEPYSFDQIRGHITQGIRTLKMGDYLSNTITINSDFIKNNTVKGERIFIVGDPLYEAIYYNSSNTIIAYRVPSSIELILEEDRLNILKLISNNTSFKIFLDPRFSNKDYENIILEKYKLEGENLLGMKLYIPN